MQTAQLVDSVILVGNIIGVYLVAYLLVATLTGYTLPHIMIPIIALYACEKFKRKII